MANRVQVASPEQLYRMPVSPELARFVGDAVLTIRLPGHLCPRPGDEVAIIVGGEVLAYRMTDPASAPTTAAQWVMPMPVLGVAKP